MIKIDDQSYTIALASGILSLTPVGSSSPRFSLVEDGPACAELRQSKVPQKAIPLLVSLGSNNSKKFEIARLQTAQQLWTEYSESWREAGETDERDVASFARAIGSVNDISLFVNEDGSPSFVSICWENTELFLGHSIFTDIMNTENWTDFSASIFG